MDFIKRYNELNTDQKKAVDLIDGPVMVVAGPGTGKTELLGMRAANIVRQTDTAPENILCLTYTDSGVNSMRQRLISIMGADAHKVGIYTFHSFCAEVINQNPDYFYSGAKYELANKVVVNEILTAIFAKLPHDNTMSSSNDGKYTQIKTAQNAISDIKRSGLTPDELLNIIDANDAVVDAAEDIIVPFFEQRMSPKLIESASNLLSPLEKIPFNCTVPNIVPLGSALASNLRSAINESQLTGKSTPLSNWKTDFTTVIDGQRALKSRHYQLKLRSIHSIYSQYLKRMDSLGLYDYDDMILQAIQKIEQNIDLKLNLQEKYQYIMVDEFQDTNMSQMRILYNLTDNEINGDMPNILVVGDDDQAIYSFQGADISNILDFNKTYPRAEIITLTENYRSNEHILSHSNFVIQQSIERLENRLDSINKTLRANHKTGDGVSIHVAEKITDENNWVAADIRRRLDAGEAPSEIAIIARGHRQIADILPYLFDAQIPVNYEKSNNALDCEIIIYIEKIARMLIALSQNRQNDANAMLPEILSHPAWNIKPADLWQLSIMAYRDENKWLEQMQKSDVFADIFNWFITTAKLSTNTSLEKMIDTILGINPPSDDCISSPLYQYYFNDTARETDPETYITYLESLRAIRQCATEYGSNQTPSLATFIKVASAYRDIGEAINIQQDFSVSATAINVMTAHSSKGLEFNNVYMINATNDNWNKNRGGRNNVSYPENLPIGRAGDNDNEKARLFFVAMTRAKHQLHICFSEQSDNGKSSVISAFLTDSDLPIQKIEPIDSIAARTKTAELQWYQPLVSPITTTMREVLRDRLTNYQLNPTALNNFIDLENGGPEQFLMNNLLRFPQASNPFTTYGNCIHSAFKYAHSQFLEKGKIKINDVVKNFTDSIAKTHLDEDELAKYTTKGTDHLTKFFTTKPKFFIDNQKSEEDFKNEGCVVGDALIGGKIDLMNINKSDKTVSVIDYKTGKHFHNWETGDSRIKAHKYRQQLMFYKLLIEKSSRYRGYTAKGGIIQFVEPDRTGNINEMAIEFDQLEIDEFIKLINAVYKKIINLDLPDTSKYSKDIAGIKHFETDLVENNI